MLKINATDMNLKQITDSAAGAKRYKADKVQAFVEGIGEVTLYVTAYGAKPPSADKNPSAKKDAVGRPVSKRPEQPVEKPADTSKMDKLEALVMALAKKQGLEF